MSRPVVALCLVLAVCFSLQAGAPESSKAHGLQVLLSEVQPGALATEQYCMLVFADRTFHAEKANRKMGKDRIRKVYEGELMEADWNSLIGILDSEQFRKLHVSSVSVPLVIPDAHSYNISVARDKEFQNIEFLDNQSRKPYESQLKPLLQWWKSIRSRRMTQSEAPPDSRCSLDSTRGVFSY